MRRAPAFSVPPQVLLFTGNLPNHPVKAACRFRDSSTPAESDVDSVFFFFKQEMAH
jgi:hypothetical protein